MRVALLPLLVGVVTFSRTNRAVRAVDSVCIVRLDRLPVTETAVEKLVPSVLVWMLKEPVFQPVFSAPRPACLTTNRFTLWLEPRSTVSDDGEVSVQNLLLLTSMPSTALGAVSLVAHAAWGLLTGLFRARFVPSAGGAGGGVNPALNEGGASAEPVPHVLALLLPMVKARVPPAAMSRNRMKFCVRAVPLSERLCTNCAPWPAPVPLIWTLPPGRCTRIEGNSGPCSASVSAPGVAGYMPRAAQTYHAEVAPRSSLPGRPPAPEVNDSFMIRRTADEVPAGRRAKLYAHGTPCCGSLPM